ncbi:P-loop containing nucleoside triphosphate hydrolase protein, partial [Atractiella rhizophila]
LRERIQRLREIADLTSPADLYRGSRKTQRHVHLHVGPTNSGKTYNALLALANAQTGVYAGPLRLLAHEIFTRFNEGGIVDKDGKPISRTCNLVTGEVVKIVADNAPLTACTVEMLQSTASSTYDVAVIDEIQMIDDVNRGVAWTAAFMSLAAKEIHLCGELRAVELIRKLCEVTGDKLTVHSYERLTPLAVAQKGLGNKLVDLSTGDCLVAFSRARIFALQQRIQRETALKVAVIYGSLPPEVRSSQAQMFNQGEVDVLVGSDAIGMGLNLKIKRIIFESLYKYGETAGGRTMHKLPSSLIGQIAGRAGRYGM